MNLAQTLTPEQINALLQAQASQVLGLTVILVIIAFLGILKIMSSAQQNQRHANDQTYDILSRQAANVTGLVEKLTVTTESMKHLSNAMDEQTLLLARIDDTSKANLGVNKQRIVDGNAAAVDIKAIHTDTQSLKNDFADGKKEVIAVVDDMRDKILHKLGDINDELNKDKAEIRENLSRIDGKLDDVLNMLKAPPPTPTPSVIEAAQAPTPPPAEPPPTTEA